MRESRLPGVRRISVLLALVLALVLGTVHVLDLPDVRALAHTRPERTSYMRVRAAELGLPGGAYRIGWAEMDSISPYLVCAVVKAEDRGFFRHGGFDWKQVRKAVGRAATGKPGMGGSTITQQTARNLLLGPERTLLRKLREALIAHRMEEAMEKRRILELYLNVIEWGDGVWGARAASAAYFGKPPAALDPFEASFLASLVAAPRRPLEGEYRARAESVQRRVLFQMYRSGLLDDDGWREAWSRVGALHEALAGGASLAAALRASREGPDPLPIPPPSRFNDVVPPLSGAVPEECGLARELEENRIERDGRGNRAP